MVLTKRYALCAASLFILSSGHARELDLRKQTDSKGETIVGFCSRPSPDAFGFPGHAFVTLIERPVGGALKFRSIGHTEASGNLPAIAFTYFAGAPVAGKQLEERFTHMRQVCLEAKVDRATFERVVATSRPTLTALGMRDELAATAESYRLRGSDCIDFMVKIAEVLRPAGLKIPARGALDLPSGYVRKLIEANP